MTTNRFKSYFICYLMFMAVLSIHPMLVYVLDVLTYGPEWFTVYIFAALFSGIILVAVFIFDIIIFLLTLVRVFLCKPKKFERLWLERVKEQLLIIVQVFMIMMIVVPLKRLSLKTPRNYEFKIVSDVVVLFSSILFFMIFRLKTNMNSKSEPSSKIAVM